MRTLGVFMLFLAQFTTLGLAIPLAADRASQVAPRSQFCANAPLTIAGTTFDRRTYTPYSLSSVIIERRHGTNTVLWCAAGSQTYIILEIIAATAETAVKALLESAYSAITVRLDSIGDGPLSSGSFLMGGDDSVELYMRNANNHQQTWGVAGLAIGALQDYMNQNGYGQATFNVFDGGTEVGVGKIGINAGQ